MRHADGSIGKEIKTRENFALNGFKIPAYLSPDVSRSLLSIPQIDRCMGRATI